jgi:hypothetical protein
MMFKLSSIHHKTSDLLSLKSIYYWEKDDIQSNTNEILELLPLPISPPHESKTRPSQHPIIHRTDKCMHLFDR